MMNNLTLSDLPQLSEVRQTIEDRPAAVARNLAVAMFCMMVTAVGWLATSHASIVIEARGVVRAAAQSSKVFTSDSPRFEGTVVEVVYGIGDVVKKGDALLVLDSSKLDAEIAETEREIELIASELAAILELKSQIDQEGRFAVRKAQAELDVAERELVDEERRRADDVELAELELEAANESLLQIESLHAKKASSKAELSQAKILVAERHHAWSQLRSPRKDSRIPMLRENLELARRSASVRIADLKVRRLAKESQLREKEAIRRRLIAERDYSIVRATVGGVITGGRIKRGDLLQAGSAVIEISPLNRTAFVALVANEDIADVSVSMPARVRLDAYEASDRKAFNARVDFIAPDATVDEQSGQLAYEICITIDDTPSDQIGPLHPKLGMAGAAELIIERRSLLTLLLGKLKHSVRLL